MRNFTRNALVILGAVSLLYAAGLFLQLSFATSAWPLPATRLSYIFLSGIVAAAGAPLIWIGLSGDYRALAAGSLNLAAIFTPTAISFSRLAGSDPSVVGHAIVTALLALASLTVYFWSRRREPQDGRPVPILVRLSFWIFTALLVITAIALVTARPNTFPWPLDPASSQIFGFILFGSAVYFLYGLAEPIWTMARGQLIGFLVYDLVLIVPFLQHFATVRPENRFSLIVYVIVLAYSGAVSVYYLFIKRSTQVTATVGSGV